MRLFTPVTVLLTVFLFSALLFSTPYTSSAEGPPEASGKVRYVWLHYDNSSGELGVSTFDGFSNTPSVSLWELLDGTRFSINYLSYDERGNLLSEERHFSEGRESWNRYVYDDQDRLSEETFERSDGGEGHSTYLYEGDRLVREDHNGLNGWLHALIDCRYNDDGQRVEATIRSRGGDSAGVIYYTYDDNGNLLKEDWQFINPWQQVFKWEYTPIPEGPACYTSANPFIRNLEGIRVATETYDYSGELGGPSYYEYDEGTNHLKQKRFVRTDGLETTSSYIYHPDGRLLRSHRMYADGRSTFFRFEYDENHALTKKEFFTSDTTHGSETYVYDDAGRLVSAEYDNMDSWLTGKLTFKSDRKGRLKSGHFISPTGVEAKIKFKVNKLGNPVKIQWKFSDGKTQTYTFTYEPI